MQLPPHFDAPVDGRFLIEHQVGAGASASVYRAFDLALQRPVALKLLTGWAGDHEAHPGLREAALLDGVDHPGIIKIWEAGFLRDLDLPFLAMEWLEGGTLRARHASSPLSTRQVTALGALTARALQAAHAAGIVHRDLKPENILLRGSFEPNFGAELGMEPVLIDFGIASREANSELSGTPAYMSPEQARGDGSVDARSDLYSLGATLFELLVGRPPHQGQSAIATLARLATTPAPRMSLFRPDLPSRLDEVVDLLLRTDAAHRPASAAEVEARLLECLDDEAPTGFGDNEPSGRLGTGASRLVTTIVAVGFENAHVRDRSLDELRNQGADAVPLGAEAVVAHLGVHQATGREAQAALELGQRLAQLGAAVGIASGRAQVRSRGSEHAAYPVGEVVDRAASLAREARATQLLVDATTAELGRGRHEFRIRDDGSAIVGSPVRAGPERSGGAPFVGREAELAQILSAYERSRVDAHSMVVTVVGPPGIGKSRLQRESIARISSAAVPPRIVVQRSDAYGRRHALGAAADVLGSLIELRKGSTVLEAEQAILESLGPTTLKDAAGDNHRLLARLLVNEPLPQGVSAAGARDALWVSMTELVAHTLSLEPLVLVMEDLQWADAESILWLDHLLGRSTTNAILLLACVRPQFWAENEGRFQQRHRLRIDLLPISKQAARAIAQAVLGPDTTAERIESIAVQAGGSPLFAEELARLAALGREGSNAPTIEAAIQVSLDALDADARDAVGRLSVLGLATWDSALVALGLPRASELMVDLSAHEILIEQSASRFAGTREFLFKHALIRDVAYSSLAETHRIELHALAGRWLSSMGGDAATVAGHLDLGQEHALAAEHWERAAQRALTAHALNDALSMADRALAFAESGPVAHRRARTLDEAWARLDPRAADRDTAVTAMEDNALDEASQVFARGARARYDDARGIGLDISERLAEALHAAATLGLPDEVARCSAALATRAAFRGDFVTAEGEAQRLLDLSSREVPGARVDAYQTLAIIRQAKGAVSAALDARRSAVGAAREAGLKERESMLTTNLGFALSTVGARHEAREALERGFVLAETIGSAGAVRHAQMNLLGWASLYGNDRRLDGYLAETRAEADAVAAGHWAAPDRSNLGVLFYRGVELLQGNTEAARSRALALLRMTVASYRNLGHLDVLPVALGAWAEAERLSGDPEQAVRIAREASELLEQGAPSLLNEAPVFLTLHKACNQLDDELGALDALSKSIRPLVRRLNGLVGSPYARGFLTDLPYNAELVAAADRAGVLPDSVHRVLAAPHDR